MNKSKRSSILHISSSSLAVFISRIAGLFRDAVNTHFFSSFYLDVFIASFRIPNIFRSIFAEGALQNSFIPVYIELKSRKEEKEFLNSFFTLFLISVFSFTLLLIILVPYFIPFIVKGYGNVSKEKIELTIFLTRFMFIYLFLISLTSFFTSILAANYNFFGTNINQAFFNITFIIIVFISYFTKKLSIFTFIYAVIIGGIIQLGSLIPYLIRMGIKITFNFKFNNYNIYRVLKLFAPSLISSSAYQINILLSTYFLALFPSAITNSYIAQRLYLLPVGLFSVALGQVYLTTFSDNLAENKFSTLRTNFARSFRISFFIAITVIGYFIATGLPVAKLLFFHGKYTIQDIERSYILLIYYLPGLIFISNTRILVSFFYSFKSYKEPIISTIVSLVVFFLSVRLTIKHLKFYSVALGNTIALIFQFVILFYFSKNYVYIRKPDLKPYLKFVFSVVIATIATYYIQSMYSWKTPSYLDLIFIKRVIFVFLLSVFYIIIIIILSYILKIDWINKLILDLREKIFKKN